MYWTTQGEIPGEIPGEMNTCMYIHLCVVCVFGGCLAGRILWHVICATSTAQSIRSAHTTIYGMACYLCHIDRAIDTQRAHDHIWYGMLFVPHRPRNDAQRAHDHRVVPGVWNDPPLPRRGRKVGGSAFQHITAVMVL